MGEIQRLSIRPMVATTSTKQVELIFGSDGRADLTRADLRLCRVTSWMCEPSRARHRWSVRHAGPLQLGLADRRLVARFRLELSAWNTGHQCSWIVRAQLRDHPGAERSAQPGRATGDRHGILWRIHDVFDF